MNHSTHSVSSIFHECEQRIMVAPTQSMARQLNQDYAALQIKQGKQSWKSPVIYSWSTLLQEWYQQCLPREQTLPYLLNQYQQHYLWQTIIRDSRISNKLLNVAATTRNAIAAYKLCREHQITIFKSTVSLNSDASVFRQWFEIYQSKLLELHACDEQMLPDTLLEYKPLLPLLASKIGFYAFDELTPQQRYFTDVLHDMGIDICFLQVAQQNKSCRYRICQDVREEIKAAAQWAKSHLRIYPETKIGIVHNDLRTHRALIEQEFDRVLGLNRLLDNTEQSGAFFSISLGITLIQYPMIAQVIGLFRLLQYHIQIDELSNILNSSFIKGWQQEADARALLDRALRKQGVLTTTIEHVIAVSRALEQPCPILFELLSEIKSFRSTVQKKQSLRQWTKIMTDILQVWGWPGSVSLKSDEFQTLEAWHKALKHMNSLEGFMQSCYFNDAIAQLKSILSQTHFQPETGHTPIHVLSSQAVSGMGFDAIWILALDDQRWPKNTQANPFVPISEQIAAGVSSASPELNLKSSKRSLMAIIQSSPEVVMSYSQKKGDQELRPSPFISAFCHDEYKIHLETDFYTQVFHSQKLERIEESELSPIQAASQVSGGSSLFQDQAACPFRAFAHHRLYAEGILSPQLGLDAKARGIILHGALQNFWQGVKHSAQLQRLSATVLNDKIHQSIDKAIYDHKINLPGTLPDAVLELEAERQFRLLRQWIELEQERQQFTVKAVEKSHRVVFSDLYLNMRIDRIDENLDGTLTIIDYKSSDPKVSDWFGERMNQPQLPLYAVTCEGKIAACLFAKIKPGDLRFIGVADSDDRIAQVKSPHDQDWHELVQEWQSQLAELAEEFKQGKVDVLPKDHNTCRYCDLQMFCRIYERCNNTIMP